MVIAGYAVWGFLLLLFALTDHLGLAIGLAFGQGVANMVFIIPSQTLFQERTPSELMGRVVGFRFALVFGSMTIALALGSVLGEIVGPAPVIAVFGGVTMIAGLAGLPRSGGARCVTDGPSVPSVHWRPRGARHPSRTPGVTPPDDRPTRRRARSRVGDARGGCARRAAERGRRDRGADRSDRSDRADLAAAGATRKHRRRHRRKARSAAGTAAGADQRHGAAGRRRSRRCSGSRLRPRARRGRRGGAPAPAPARAPTPSEVATRVTETPSQIFVIGSVAIFALILLFGLVGGQDGFLTKSPAPSASAEASAAASASAESIGRVASASASAVGIGLGVRIGGVGVGLGVGRVAIGLGIGRTLGELVGVDGSLIR